MHNYTEVYFACRQQCVSSSLLECLLLQGAVGDVSGDEALFFEDPELAVEQRRIVGDGTMRRQHLVANKKGHQKRQKQRSTVERWSAVGAHNGWCRGLRNNCSGCGKSECRRMCYSIGQMKRIH